MLINFVSRTTDMNKEHTKLRVLGSTNLTPLKTSEKYKNSYQGQISRSDVASFIWLWESYKSSSSVLFNCVLAMILRAI